MDLNSRSVPKPLRIRGNPCLNSAMETLFEKRSKTGDIKFIVDGEEIRAHRCVLAALSFKFEAQFHGPLEEKHTINVEGVTPAAFEEFLQFFYKDEVALTLDNIEHVLNLVKQSLIDEFVMECESFIMENIGVDKLLWSHQLAQLYDLNSLEAFCVKQIGVNIRTVFQSMEFLRCERDTLCQILDFKPMNCNGTDVFDACISWARSKCERDQIDATNTGNLRMALGEAISKIPFDTLEFREFATINREYRGLLSAEEAIDVYEAIAAKTIDVNLTVFGNKNKLPAAVVEKSSSECSFSKGQRLKIDFSRNYDYIVFYYNKKIKLNGFIICSRIDSEIKVEVKIEGEEKRPTYTASISENETKIIFDDPIEMRSCKCCTIRIFSETLRQPSASLYGLKLEECVVQNGVKFQIPQPICNKLNLITTLLFDICMDVKWNEYVRLYEQ